jgi:excisionase family DNA binding protein
VTVEPPVIGTEGTSRVTSKELSQRHGHPRVTVDDKLGHGISRTAHLLDVSRPTIYKLIAEGRLRCITIGTRRIVTSESIAELLND